MAASTKSTVEAAEGSKEARRKDNNGCTEVRNSEEVPAVMCEMRRMRSVKKTKVTKQSKEM